FGEMKSFTSDVIKLKKGDVLYASSDGFSDQFGGEKNKKYRRKNFKDLLLKIHKEEMFKQKQILDESIMDWMDGYSQIDDIIVTGIKID
ncbi:MAG: serine/threonine protein phosphatase, partial [Bacteroidota bacterium]|nr:serine/threonine protein phosphatase [Bacteroidota bacterium]